MIPNEARLARDTSLAIVALTVLRLVGAMRESGQDVPGSLATFRIGLAHPTANGWEHVFYDAVLETPTLLAYLTNADLPPYL